MKSFWCVSLMLGLVDGGAIDAAQRPQPLGGGTAIQANDGDLIVMEGDARIRLVRRREANVTAVYNEAERWLILMVAHAREGRPPDGGIGTDFRYHEVSDWPRGERWTGAVVMDEYIIAGDLPGATASVGLTTDSGLIRRSYSD